jgi:hypothetical protein
LFVFAFDLACEHFLKELKLPHMTIISLNEFEDEELLRVKKERTAGEYCWTCTPSTIRYCLRCYGLSSCTYVDADLYFFSNPRVLIEEMDNCSVLITEHRYTPRYDQSETSGIYCVQFMTFKNNEQGMEVLEWWREACLDWCFSRVEDGKFGDQKYLDDWLIRFKGIHVLEHLGGGLAPWNIQQYDFSKVSFEVVFFHFHQLKFYSKERVDLGTYILRDLDLRMFYSPYIKHMLNVAMKLEQLKSGFVKFDEIRLDWSLKGLYVIIKRLVDRCYNIYNVKNLD